MIYSKKVLAFDMESFCQKLLPFTAEQYFKLAVVAIHLALQREKDSSFKMPSFLEALLSNFEEETARRERADHELSKERVDQRQSKGMAEGEQEADERHGGEGEGSSWTEYKLWPL